MAKKKDAEAIKEKNKYAIEIALDQIMAMEDAQLEATIKGLFTPSDEPVEDPVAIQYHHQKLGAALYALRKLSGNQPNFLARIAKLK